MEKKYEFTGEIIELGNVTFRRIRALKDFGDVKAGDLGGWIEKEENLSHEGNCWVYENANVFGKSKILEDAEVRGGAAIIDSMVCGCAKVYGRAVVSRSFVYDKAEIYGHAIVSGLSEVYCRAKIYENAEVKGCAIPCSAKIHGHAVIERKRIEDNEDIF